MLNLHRAADLLDRFFPSVPPKDQALILAAMEGRDLTPVSTSQGEGSVETGPATSGPTSLGPSGTAGDGPVSVRPVPGRPPVCELVMSEPVHPACRYLLEDRHLAQLLTQWGATS